MEKYPNTSAALYLLGCCTLLGSIILIAYLAKVGTKTKI